MQETVSRGGLIILATFMVACVLAIIPLPDNVAVFRPEWVSLVLIFWCMNLPHRVGVFSGWSAGLFMDVLYGTLLGQYALTMSLLAFITYKFQARMRLYPFLQQSLIILILIALQQMISLWVKGLTGSLPHNVTYWMPSVTSTLMWPVVAILLHKIRKIYGIV